MFESEKRFMDRLNSVNVEKEITDLELEIIKELHSDGIYLQIEYNRDLKPHLALISSELSHVMWDTPEYLYEKLISSPNVNISHGTRLNYNITKNKVINDVNFKSEFNCGFNMEASDIETLEKMGKITKSYSSYTTTSVVCGI